MATNTLWTVNGTVQEKAMNAKDMLTSNPPGAYTTARTVDGGTAVFQLKFHIDRLATSMQLMREQQSKGGPEAEAHDCTTHVPTAVTRATDTAEVATRVHHAIVSGVRDYRARFADAVGSNLRLTVLVTWPQPTVTVASEAAGKASGGGGSGGSGGSGSGGGGSV